MPNFKAKNIDDEYGFQDAVLSFAQMFGGVICNSDDSEPIT